MPDQPETVSSDRDHEGVTLPPALEMLNTVVPLTAAPEAPVTLLRTVVWPPVLNVSVLANAIVAQSSP